VGGAGGQVEALGQKTAPDPTSGSGAEWSAESSERARCVVRAP
jgi:hypothetical protein